MKAKHTIESVNQHVAEKHNGRCIRIFKFEYAPGKKRTDGEFICVNNHNWVASLSNVMSKTKGTWCSICHKNMVRNRDVEKANRRAIADAKRMGEPVDPEKIAAREAQAEARKALRMARLAEVRADTALKKNADKAAAQKAKKDAELAKKEEKRLAALAAVAEREARAIQRNNERNAKNAAKAAAIATMLRENNIQRNLLETQEDVNAFAITRGGRCISIYTGAHDPTQWECAQGHQWWATYAAVKFGAWCKSCALVKMRWSQADIDEYAKSKGGKCLTQYTGIFQHLQWECANRHQWWAMWSTVKQHNSWCRTCFANNNKLTQDDINNFATSRELKCHSVYVDSGTPMKWECPLQHEWMANLISVKHSKTGCPYCFKSSESICRVILEQLVGGHFIKVRPEWIVNPEGNLLELDGYNEEKKIAFEYNGRQHYVVSDWWDNDEAELVKQQTHDKIKLERCAERGITLIVIPYTCSTYDKKVKFITDELTKHGHIFDINNLKR